jgi:hypothetical protein
MAMPRDKILPFEQRGIAHKSPDMPLADQPNYKRFLKRIRPHLMGILRAIDDECGMEPKKVKCTSCGVEFRPER